MGGAELKPLGICFQKPEEMPAGDNGGDGVGGSG